MEKSLFLIIDGNALVHRAFHAMERSPSRLSVSTTGEPTGAVYVFIRMLLKMLQEYQPEYWGIAFDLPAPTFRHRQYEDYKAGRKETPDDLKLQFGRVRQLAEALRIPVFELEGYEADDVLGALSRQATAQGIDTIIASGDADVLQLVSAKVKVLVPRRSLDETVLYDEAAVQEKCGVAPSQVPDLKALSGDASDNIPGVPGIGEKTAARLLQQFASVEGVYEHIQEVTPPRIRDALATGEGMVKRNKTLATLITDLPVVFEPNSCRRSQVDRDKVLGLFRELEFSSLLSKWREVEAQFAGQPAGGGSEGPPEPDGGEYVLVGSMSALEELVAQLSSVATIAIRMVKERKTDSQLVGIALSPGPGRAYYLPVGHRGLEQPPQLDMSQAVKILQPLLEDPRVAKVSHDGKEDMTFLSDLGVQLRNLSFDTMIAGYLLGEKSLTLPALASSRLVLEMAPSSVASSKQASLAEASASLAARHVGQEADVIGKLRQPLEQGLRERGLWPLFTEVEMPLVTVLARMERHGVAVDGHLLRGLSQRLGEQMRKLEEDIYSNVGHSFNLNSPQQLGTVLFEEIRLPTAKRTKTGYSTSAPVLEGLRGLHPVIGMILEYRQLTKLKSTYVDALPGLINPRTGRIHSSFNQAVTATGRLSSSEPNLQNIPIRTDLGQQIRRAFIAEPPCFLVKGDYSQVELRVLAHLSQDPLLLTAFNEDKDIHAATAAEVFGVNLYEVTPEMRRVAKVVNFGVIYGMSEYGLEQATDFSWEEAAKFIDSYFQRYVGVKAYLESLKQQAKECGYVQTLLGRRRYTPDIESSNRQVREAAERMAINMPVQGTAADIIKVAMVKLQREMDERRLKSKMILQVHDELLFEVPPEELEEMKGLAGEVMAGAVALSVPLRVEVKAGRNWGEMGGD